MKHFTAAQLIAFEAKIAARFKAGELPFLVHFSGGNEEQLIKIFEEINEDDWILCSHRAHHHALLKGLSEEWLEKEICEGRSMFLFSKEKRMLCSAILGGTCGIAAGLALAFKHSGSGQRAWCFLGDGAEENGHFYEAALFVEAHDLPCTFIIEDNRRQVDTPKSVRRGERGAGQVVGGAYVCKFPAHYPLDHFKCVRRYYYHALFPHGGCGLPPGSVTFDPVIVARHAAK